MVQLMAKSCITYRKDPKLWEIMVYIPSSWGHAGFLSSAVFLVTSPTPTFSRAGSLLLESPRASGSKEFRAQGFELGPRV